MIKIRKSVLGIFASITSMALTSCGSTKEVVFWSSFGEKYSKILDGIVADIAAESQIEIKHHSSGSYPGVLKEMVAAIPTRKYPSLAVGYPDHFAQYHGSSILKPLDKLISKDVLADYDEDYMLENYLYDTNGKPHLYGVPFNKSTELLGYNGVFVDYCAWKYSDPDLKNLPKTWDEWACADNPATKSGKYQEAFRDLVDNKRTLYALQDEDGTAHDFEVFTGVHDAPAGKTKCLDYSDLGEDGGALTVLMSWDSTDNGFITLLRQWDSQYTKLPEEERQYHPKERQGKIMFATPENLPKTIEMLKYFNRMHSKKIFGTPDDVKGGNFSSEAYATGRTMFMICSSGGLSYNTDHWEKRFRLAPIPYKDEQHKFVISQGANICLTKNGNAQKSAKVLEALTSGKFQTQWAMETGYFPASKRAADDTYKAFINGTDYRDPTVVSYRDGARVNENEYKNGTWTRFVDDAFIGSAVIRTVCNDILGNAFLISDIENDAAYKRVLRRALEDTQISSNMNIMDPFEDTGL